MNTLKIDFHSHYGTGDGKRITINKLLRHRKENKISKMVLFPVTSAHLIKESLEILNLSKKYEWIVPFCRINPNTITKEKLKNLLHQGFKGVKLHPHSQSFNPLNRKFSWIFRIIQEYNIPVIFHCKSYHFEPNSHPEKLLKLARRHPNQLFVFGHFAGVNKKLFKEFKKHKNIYVETSIDVTPNAYREVVLKYKFDRLLFGTDFPYSFGEIELIKLKMANLPLEIVEKILYKNAEKILKLSHE